MSHRAALASEMFARCVAISGVLAMVGGCGRGYQPPTSLPPTVTFEFQNGGATSVYVYVAAACVVDMTVTELVDPPVSIGLLRGQGGTCDCSVVGPCAFQGTPFKFCPGPVGSSLEVAAGAVVYEWWTPVDLTYVTVGARTCSETTLIPTGHYRVDVPVYASQADSSARTRARVVSQTFDLPATEAVVLPLAAP